MVNLYFDAYKDGTEGKMASMRTFEEMIPINIHLEPGSDSDLTEDTVCSTDIFADEDELYIFKDEEAYCQAETLMAPYSLMPIGTFNTTPDGTPVNESPFILFSGEIINVIDNPNPNKGDSPDYLVAIKSYDLIFNLYLYADDHPHDSIEKGAFIHGTAWLFGVVKRQS